MKKSDREIMEILEAFDATGSAHRAGHRRTYRPWITEPGLWLQFDWGEGPKIPGPDGTPRRTWLFCAWLAWSRFRVVIPVWDQTLPTLITCLDATLHRLGGVPTYVLTDNRKTVSIDHVAGVPVRHPQIVEVGRHYGMQVHTCVPFDPESKGGTEATVKIAKADLVLTDANLRADYASFAELEAACETFTNKVNARRHRESARVPVEALAEEGARLHVLPRTPHTMAWGRTRRMLTARGIKTVIPRKFDEIAARKRMALAGVDRPDSTRPHTSAATSSSGSPAWPNGGARSPPPNGT